MEMEQLEYAIRHYGTPLYIFDMDILTDEINRMRRALDEKIGLCYAMKANPFLTLQMSGMTGKVEVCSMGEFQICKSLNVEPEKLLISGVMKKREDIEQILDYVGSRGAYTMESIQQFRILANWCKEHQKVIHVYPRLTSGNQFGMDEQAIIDIINARHLYPFMEIEGIHYFSGTQKKSLNLIQKELDYLDSFFERLKEECGFTVKELEYGPGLGISYFPDKKLDVTSDESLHELSEMVQNMKWKGHVTLEMGRAMAAVCGYYLTKIRDVKRNKGKNYCIVDGGNHQINYDGQIRGMYRPYVQISPPRPKEGEEENWTVCGALCSVNDILCQSLPIKEAKEGDVLIFGRTGAYAMTEGMALFLSHALPAAVLYSSKEGWKLLRESQPTYKWNMSKEDL